jgi:hypothetical protein
MPVPVANPLHLRTSAHTTRTRGHARTHTHARTHAHAHHSHVPGSIRGPPVDVLHVRIHFVAINITHSVLVANVRTVNHNRARQSAGHAQRFDHRTVHGCCRVDGQERRWLSAKATTPWDCQAARTFLEPTEVAAWEDQVAARKLHHAQLASCVGK